MSRPSDPHLDLLDETAYERVADAIAALEEAGVDYVLGGGWAVFAHAPRVPSIDVDVYAASGDGTTAQRAIEEVGLNVAKGGEVELLGLDSEIKLWGVGDPDLGIPEPGYVPREVFEGHLEERPLPLESREPTAMVPDRSSLLITKVVALANRDLAYRSFSQGAAAMRLGPQLKGRVRAKARGYWQRKAGKDLFDSGLLLSDQAGPAAFDLLEALGLVERIERGRERLVRLRGTRMSIELTPGDAAVA